MAHELLPAQTQPTESDQGSELVPVDAQDLAQSAHSEQAGVLDTVVNPEPITIPRPRGPEVPELPAAPGGDGPVLTEDVRSLPAADESPDAPPALSSAEQDESQGSEPEPTPPETVRETDGDFVRTPSGNKVKIVIAGLDENLTTQSKEAGQQRLNKELAGKPEDGRAKKILRHMWKGSIMRPRYEAKYTEEARQDIIRENNLLYHEGVTRDEYTAQTVRRFGHEFDEHVRTGDLIDEAAGEKLEDLHALVESGDPGAKELRDTIYGLVERYASGDIGSDADFAEAKKHALNGLAEKGVARELIGSGLFHADNLQEIARMVKAESSSQQMAVRDILNEASIVVGKARIGARTEYDKTTAEHITGIINKLHGKEAAIEGGKSAIFNEVTIATAVAVATYGAKRGVSAALHTVAPGVAAGLFAGMREAQSLKRERKQHSREMAAGKLDAGSLEGRRADLEKARYETASAGDLIAELGDLYGADGKLSVTSAEQMQDALYLVAEIEARRKLSNRDKIDLISFSSVNAIQQERTDLYLAAAKAKVDLRHQVAKGPLSVADILGSVELAGKFTGPRRELFDVVLKNNADAAEGMLVGDISEADKEYRSLRNARVAKAMVKGVVLGEIVAEAEFVGHGLTNVAEHGSWTDASTHSTQAAQEVFANQPHSVPLSDTAKLTLPPDFQASVHEDVLTVTGPHGFHTVHEHLNHDGSLSAQAQETLHHDGFNVKAESNAVISKPEVSHPTVNVHEFVANHQKSMTKVSRSYWYDNNTPNKFDLNELKMDYGGHDGSGVAENGDYQFNVSGMTENGSFHGPDAAEWQQAAASGHLEIALSASESTQSQVFLVHIGENGVVDIPKGSPEAALFSTVDGHAQFNGGYAETVQILGHQGGVTHIAPLATVVGQNHESFTDTVTTDNDVPATEYIVTHGSPSTPGDALYEPTPVPIPLARDGLTPTPEQPRVESKEGDEDGTPPTPERGDRDTTAIQPARPEEDEMRALPPAPVPAEPDTPAITVTEEGQRREQHDDTENEDEVLALPPSPVRAERRPQLSAAEGSQDIPRSLPSSPFGFLNDEGAQEAFARGGEEGYLRYVRSLPSAETAPQATGRQQPRTTPQPQQADDTVTPTDDSGQTTQATTTDDNNDNRARRRQEEVRRERENGEDLAREQATSRGRINPAFLELLDSGERDPEVVFAGIPRGNPPAVQDLAARMIEAAADEVKNELEADSSTLSASEFRERVYRRAQNQASIISLSQYFGRVDDGRFGGAVQLLKFLKKNADKTADFDRELAPKPKPATSV